MKALSKITIPVVLVTAFAGVSSFIGTCQDGFCELSGVQAAQISRGPVAPKRDPQMEKDSAHHLDVAWQYYKRKLNKDDPQALSRVNKAIADRLNEILDTNPDFSKVDEVYFLLGEVSLRDGNPEYATKYFSFVADKYPDSKFNKDAKKRLVSLSNDAGKAAAGKKEGNKKS